MSHLPRPIPPSSPVLIAPKSHTHFKDPRWKSNSINQTIAQHTVGIPMSRPLANEVGRGCGEGLVCVCFCMCAIITLEACWRGNEKAGWGRAGAGSQRLFTPLIHCPRSTHLSISCLYASTFVHFQMLVVYGWHHIFFLNCNPATVVRTRCYFDFCALHSQWIMVWRNHLVEVFDALV